VRARNGEEQVGCRDGRETRGRKHSNVGKKTKLYFFCKFSDTKEEQNLSLNRFLEKKENNPR